MLTTFTEPKQNKPKARKLRSIIWLTTAIVTAIGLTVVSPTMACGEDASDNTSDSFKETSCTARSALSRVSELPYAADIKHHLSNVDESHAFSSMLCSIGQVNLEQYGYLEREFLQQGSAGIYTLDANNRAVTTNKTSDYATRLLVRYPSDPMQFSGRVYIDILNASSGIDLEDLWRRSWEHLLENGHAYVGITSKSLTANALKRFDPQRYQDLQWQVDGADENGLLWDMLSQLGGLLRQPKASGLLGGLTPDWLYLTGQSQSGMVLNTYLVAFADQLIPSHAGKPPLFDGYLNLVGPSVKPISSAGTLPSQVYRPSAVPLIAIMSEAEHAMARVRLPAGTPKIAEYQRPKDGNSRNKKFRFYEVAGAPHADPTSPILPNNVEIGKANLGKVRTPIEYANGHVETELNIDPFVNAALDNLHKWVVNGTPPPSADSHWIEYDIGRNSAGEITHTARRDINGNTLGGLRAPQLAVPLHRFYANKPDGSFAFSGSMVQIDRQQLAKMYPQGRKVYLKKFTATADKLVKQRYLLPHDAADLKLWAAEQTAFEVLPEAMTLGDE